MATTKTVIEALIKATGLRDVVADSAKFSANMASGAKSANSIRPNKIPNTTQENIDRGVGRAAMPGGTGASARDFAKEAQGLGGLVRLYATYAANIFAVGAAYRALSNAADTSNMVRGLNQLGAASGTALGSLSKRLVEATDGAISLREAMEATAKASSSGISSENILRIGKVAKTAAQALGVDMSDAVNRLTRGITKLEPELLDELGIFTRVDSAVKEYAKSVNKSVSALTDFERRMAFANAALAEGEKKFSAIELDTNPYTKLVASIKDVAQSGLELVNKVLIPIVNYLSQSPTALATVMAGIGVTLLRQALPAIGQFKDSLKEAAEESAQLAKKKADDALNARKTQNARILAEIDNDAEVKLARVEASERRITEAQKAGLDKRSALYKILQKQLPEITDKDFAKIESSAKALDTKGLKEQAEFQRTYATELKAAIAAEQKYIETRKAKTIELEKETKSWSTFGQTQRNALEAARVATLKNITANAAYIGSTEGVTAAVKQMNLQLAGAGITGFSKYATLAKGGVYALAGAVSTLGTALSGAFFWLGIITAGLTLLDSIFSKNTKQLDSFKSSVERTDSSLDNLNKTISLIKDKPLDKQFNAQSLMATSTAVVEISDSVKKLTSDIISVDKSAGVWDRFIDGFKSIWSGDIRSKFSDSMAKTISSALDSSIDDSSTKQARERLAEILNIKPNFKLEDLKKSIASVAGDEAKLKLIAKAIEAIGTASGITASKSQQVDVAFKKAQDSFKALVNGFTNKDPLAVFAEDLILSSKELAIALEDPKLQLQKLAEIANNSDNYVLFNKQDQELLSQYSSELIQINNEYREQENSVKAATDKLQEYNDTLEKLSQLKSGPRNGLKNLAVEEAQKAQQQAQKALDEQKTKLNATQEKITNITAKFPTIAANQLEKGAEFLSVSIAASMQKGSFALKDAVLTSLGNIPGVAQAREKMELAKLASDASLLKIMAQQIQATKENSVAIELANAQAEKRNLDNLARESKGDSSIANQRDKAATKVQEIEYKLKLVQADPKDVLKSIEQVVAQVKAGNKEIAQDSDNLMKFFSSLAGVGAQLAANANQAQAVHYNAIIGKLQEEQDKIKRNNQVRIQGAEAQLTLISQYETINGILDDNRIKEREKLSLLKNELDAQTKLAEIETKRSILIEAQRSKATKLTPEQFDAEQGRLNSERSGVITGLNSAASSIELKTQEDLRKLEEFRIRGQRELNDLTVKRNLILAETQKLTRDIQLETTKATNKYREDVIKAIEEEISREDSKYSAKKAAEEEFQSYKRAQEDLYRERQKTTDIEKLDLIDKQLSKQTEVHDAILAQIEEKKQAELSSIDEIANYRKSREDFNSTIESIKMMDNLWAGVGTKLADIATASDNLANIQRQNAEDLARLQAKKDKTDDPEEKLQIEKDIQRSKKKSADTELQGNLQVLSSTKKLFKEKSGAYKAISAIEKAMYTYKMLMEAKTMAQALVSAATQTAASLGLISVKATEAVANQGGGDPYTAFARIAAMIVLMASVTGKKVSGSVAGMSAADQQAVQGTGQDYVNGQLVDNGGGVLGDKTAKSKDIQDSLSIIADNTTETILFDSKAVYYLRAIEANTKELAAQFFRVEGLVDGSAFGTKEGSSKSGLFGSKRSTSIIDSGIRAIGNLGDILNNPQGFFQLYETVQTTKKKWYGSTRTTTTVNTRPLEEDVTEILAEMFLNIKDTIVSLGETFNLDVSASLEAVIASTDVNFQISARDLKGTDLLEAIASEIGVTMNQVVARVYPFLEQFQQVGEGMLTTLTRVTTEVEVVNGMFQAMGVNFLDSFTQGFALVDSKEIIKRRDEAYARYLRADAASKEVTDFYDTIVESGGGDAGTYYTTITTGIAQTEAELKELNAALEEYNQLNSQVNTQMYSNITATLEVYESLIELEGGLERFTERSQFFLDNFVPETVKLENTTRVVTNRMQELGYASVDTRDEFYELVRGLDLSTEAGRQLYSNLMDVAPAFDQVATASENAAKEAARQLESAISNAGISANTMADIITKGMLGQMERSEAGIALANMVVGGVYTAIAQNAIQPVIDLIISGIIQPVIAAAIAGESISGAVSQQSIDAVMASAQAAMSAIGQIFNDPGFQALMGELTNTFNNLIPQSSFTPYVPQTYVAPTTSNTNAYKEAVDSALKSLEKSINAEKEILTAQLKTQQEFVKSIEELISVLDSNIKDLLNSVETVVAMNAKQGAQFITNALAQAIQSGVLPDAKDLSEAIGAVRQEIDQGNYASKFEADRARLILAGQLDQLKVTSTAQKSNAEMQLDSLNNQITYLDNLLDQSKAQVDALYGVTNAVVSVSSAISALQSAIVSYKPGGGVTTPQSTYGASFGGGSGGIKVTGGFNEVQGGPDGKALLPEGGVKGYFNPDGTVRQGSQAYMIAALTGNGFDADRYLELNPDVAAWYNANGSAAIAAADQGNSIEQFALYHFSKHGAAEGRQFADGGIFTNSVVMSPTNFNADLMGEAGPEAIVPLSKMPDGSLGVRSNTMAEDFKALIVSNNELRKELVIIKQQLYKTANNTTEFTKLMEDVVRGGEVISVEVTNTVKTTSV